MRFGGFARCGGFLIVGLCVGVCVVLFTCLRLVEV